MSAPTDRDRFGRDQEIAAVVTEDGNGDAANALKHLREAVETDTLAEVFQDDAAALLAEVERLTGERDEAIHKRAIAEAGLKIGGDIIYEKWQAAEAQVGRLSKKLADTETEKIERGTELLNLRAEVGRLSGLVAKKNRTLTQISDPSYAGWYTDHAVVAMYRKWALAALREDLRK